jgi:hypothetical protein
MRTCIRLTLILFFVCLLSGVLIGPGRQPAAQAQGSSELPPPHLGYGIHIGPLTEVSPSWVEDLKMDW